MESFYRHFIVGCILMIKSIIFIGLHIEQIVFIGFDWPNTFARYTFQFMVFLEMIFIYYYYLLPLHMYVKQKRKELTRFYFIAYARNNFRNFGGFFLLFI